MAERFILKSLQWHNAPPDDGWLTTSRNARPGGNEGRKDTKMTAVFDGKKVKIPRGYHLTENGTYMNGHGVEYALVSYGWKDDEVICLETINGYRHTRTIELEPAP